MLIISSKKMYESNVLSLDGTMRQDFFSRSDTSGASTYEPIAIFHSRSKLRCAAKCGRNPMCATFTFDDIAKICSLNALGSNEGGDVACDSYTLRNYIVFD